jgi:hypothetical protein
MTPTVPKFPEETILVDPGDPGDLALRYSLLRTFQEENAATKVYDPPRLSPGLRKKLEKAKLEIVPYVFSMNPAQFLWGKARPWCIERSPTIPFWGRRLFVNVHEERVVYVDALGPLAGKGRSLRNFDGFEASPLATGEVVTMIAGPGEPIQARGTWGTRVPKMFLKGHLYTLAIDLQGWAVVPLSSASLSKTSKTQNVRRKRS